MLYKSTSCLLLFPTMLGVFSSASGLYSDGFDLLDAVLLYGIAVVAWFIQSKTNCKQHLAYIGIEYREENSLKYWAKSSIIYWAIASLLIYLF